MDHAKKIGACLLALTAMGISVDRVAEAVFAAGKISAKLEEHETRLNALESGMSAHSAMIMSTRQNIDDKIDKALRDLTDVKALASRIEGEMRRIK